MGLREYPCYGFWVAHRTLGGYDTRVSCGYSIVGDVLYSSLCLDGFQYVNEFNFLHDGWVYQ